MVRNYKGEGGASRLHEAAEAVSRAFDALFRPAVLVILCVISEQLRHL